MKQKKRCPKHVWRHKGSYTEIVGNTERYTEHYKCANCRRTKRIVPSMKKGV